MVKEIELAFGKTAVKIGYLTEEQLKKCLEIQEAQAQEKSLNVIMMEQGYLTTEQLANISQLQILEAVSYPDEQTLRCPNCQTRYNISLFRSNAKFICWKCGNELTVPSRKHPGKSLQAI